MADKLKWETLTVEDPTPFCGNIVRAGHRVGTFNGERRAVIGNVAGSKKWWFVLASHSAGHLYHSGRCVRRLDEAKAMANANAFNPERDNALQIVLGHAGAQLEDLESGVEQGLYEEGENRTDIEALRNAIAVLGG